MKEKKKSAASWILKWAGQERSAYVWSVVLAVGNVIKFLGENPEDCPCDEAKKYFSKSLMSISSEYNRSNSIKGTFN